MPVIRTPDERFQNLPDFPYTPHYVQEDKGEEIARYIVEFMQRTPLAARNVE